MLPFMSNKMDVRGNGILLRQRGARPVSQQSESVFQLCSQASIFLICDK